MFKRQPKPRDDDIALRALEKLNEQGKDQRDAKVHFDAGQAAEADGDIEGAIVAYLACAEAWQRSHLVTGHPVPPEAYLRLGVLLRKVKDLEGEINALESYLAHAGRDPDRRIQERLERAYELAEAAEDAAAAAALDE